MKKKCELCDREFEAQRDSARFCSSACRSKHWQKGKSSSEADNVLHSQLRGTLSDESDDAENNVVKNQLQKAIQINPEYSKIEEEIRGKETEYERLRIHGNKLIHERNLLLESAGVTKIATTLFGSFMGASIDSKSGWNGFVIGGMSGLFGGHLISNSKMFRKNNILQINNISTEINDISAKLTFLRKEIVRLRNFINDINPIISREVSCEANPEYNGILKDLKGYSETPRSDQNNANKRLTIPPPASDNAKSAKIIASTELKNIEYKALGFRGRWKDFLGQPSINFQCAISGPAGGGKSNFAIQFASYLAANFGTVIYVSGEEGISKTMKDKIINNQAESEYLHLADLRNYKELKEEVPANKYNFIFLDSLDNMRIGAQELKEIKLRYRGSALITISQSTKDGKMRGSNEIVHDADITIRVTKGEAETIKNRFLETEKIYRIFSGEPNAGFYPNNVIEG